MSVIVTSNQPAEQIQPAMLKTECGVDGCIAIDPLKAFRIQSPRVDLGGPRGFVLTRQTMDDAFATD